MSNLLGVFIWNLSANLENNYTRVPTADALLATRLLVRLLSPQGACFVLVTTNLVHLLSHVPDGQANGSDLNRSSLKIPESCSLSLMKGRLMFEELFL